MVYPEDWRAKLGQSVLALGSGFLQLSASDTEAAMVEDIFLTKLEDRRMVVAVKFKDPASISMSSQSDLDIIDVVFPSISELYDQEHELPLMIDDSLSSGRTSSSNSGRRRLSKIGSKSGIPSNL